jgi:hypothetical protein
LYDLLFVKQFKQTIQTSLFDDESAISTQMLSKAAALPSALVTAARASHRSATPKRQLTAVMPF